MSLEVVGNLLMAAGIIAGGITFIVVNVNYQPDEEKKDD